MDALISYKYWVTAQIPHMGPEINVFSHVINSATSNQIPGLFEVISPSEIEDQHILVGAWCCGDGRASVGC